jgi:hypothetical protein
VREVERICPQVRDDRYATVLETVTTLDHDRNGCGYPHVQYRNVAGRKPLEPERWVARDGRRIIMEMEQGITELEPQSPTECGARVVECRRDGLDPHVVVWRDERLERGRCVIRGRAEHTRRIGLPPGRVEVRLRKLRRSLRMGARGEEQEREGE